jgi:hypothetical protein
MTLQDVQSNEMGLKEEGILLGLPGLSKGTIVALFQ